MSRIRTCTSASNISSCEFVQRLEKTCKMVVVLNVVACALNSDVSKKGKMLVWRTINNHLYSAGIVEEIRDLL